MKLASWNVNGIRAAHRAGFAKWFEANRFDVVCLQETKAHEEQLEPAVRNPRKYHSQWHSAQKKGYSGVALISKHEPLRVQHGLGKTLFDREGRVLIAEFKGFTLINAYFPNSQRDHARLPYKLAFCARMKRELDARVAKGQNVVLCGDFNIAHTELDLARPKANLDNAGFLPKERAWMSQLLDAGYTDCFRHFVKSGGHYTWWSQRAGVRAKNIGWRLDTFVCNAALNDRLRAAKNQITVRGSDHCPVVLELRD